MMKRVSSLAWHCATLQPTENIHAAKWVAERKRYEIVSNGKMFEYLNASDHNLAGAIAAIQFTRSFGPNLQSYISLLAQTFRDRLSELEEVTIHDRGETKGGNVTFSIKGINPIEVRDILERYRVNVAASLPGHAPLHFMGENNRDGVVRISGHAFVDYNDVTWLVETIKDGVINQSRPLESSQFQYRRSVAEPNSLPGLEL